MAAQTERNPYFFDAAGQGYDGQIDIMGIRVVTTGTSGQFVIKNFARTRILFRSSLLDAAAQDHNESLCPGLVQDGLYIEQCPVGGEVYVWIR